MPTIVPGRIRPGLALKPVLPRGKGLQLFPQRLKQHCLHGPNFQGGSNASAPGRRTAARKIQPTKNKNGKSKPCAARPWPESECCFRICWVDVAHAPHVVNVDLNTSPKGRLVHWLCHMWSSLVRICQGRFGSAEVRAARLQAVHKNSSKRLKAQCENPGQHRIWVCGKIGDPSNGGFPLGVPSCQAERGCSQKKAQTRLCSLLPMLSCRRHTLVE